MSSLSWKKKKDAYLCDFFLDQTLFAGSGNIVKNEVLFNLRVHPLTKLSQVPKADWPKLIEGVHDYCKKFYLWKKKFELRQHWQVYRRYYCPLCDLKLTRENDGKWKRKSFFCGQHQALAKKRKVKLELHAVLPLKKPKEKEFRLDH